METMATNEQTSRQTISNARWFTRIKSGEASKRERDAYAKRMNSDPTFSSEQTRMAEIWDIALDLENDPEVRKAITLRPAPHSSGKVQSRHRAIPALAGIAATVLFALSAVLFWSSKVPLQPTYSYSTATGEQKTIHLEDGSIIKLNSGTQIQLLFDDTQRQARLLTGETTFKVTPDPKRPFEVHTQNGIIRVLGTVFNVEIVDQHTAQVSVLEGEVQIITSDRDTLLQKNQAVRYDSNGQGLISATATERIRSWHNGRIRFDDMPLKAILEEYNRYSTTKYYVDPKDEAVRFSGSFTLKNKDKLIKAVQDSSGIRIHTDKTRL